jgi:hypothetical protein
MIKDTINDGRKNDPYWWHVVKVGAIVGMITYWATSNFGASIVFIIGILGIDHYNNYRKKE